MNAPLPLGRLAPDPDRRTPPGFDPKIERERLRDTFAGRAMEGLLGDLQLMHQGAAGDSVEVGEFIGKLAYEIADGMMKARKRRGEK